MKLSTRRSDRAAAEIGVRRLQVPGRVIVPAVRWFLRCDLSYRDLEEFAGRAGVEVDHVSVFRWVRRFTPLLADAARFCRHAPGDRWFVDAAAIAGRVTGK
jgi:transposase-like protein